MGDPAEGSPVRRGDRVRHPRHGGGTVLRVLDDGRRALVRFTGLPGVPTVVGVAQLEVEEAAPPAEAPPRAVAQPEVPWEGSLARRGAPDRQTLEALRLGVVPRTGLHALTVGRHEEVARLDELLDRCRGLRLIIGGYGSGKSHMVELCEAEGRARGFLVARATFDPVEVPPSHPLRLYRALMSELCVGNGPPGAGLRPLLESLEPEERFLKGELSHRWLSPALFAVHKKPGLAEEILGFVEGQGSVDHQGLTRKLRRAGYEGPGFLGLPDYRTFGQIMAYLLGGVAVWAREAGHRGLLVLLDEAEYLDALGPLSREMARNVLRYLAIGTLEDGRLSFDPETVYKGGQKVHRAVRPRFAADQPLAVVAALTPDPAIRAALKSILADEDDHIELMPLRQALLPLLAEKVYGVVQAVHPAMSPEPAHRQRITRALQGAFQAGEVSSPRQAARLVVEFWDIYRVDPRRALAALR